MLKMVFSMKNVSHKGCNIHVRLKKMFSPSWPLAWDLCSVTDAMKGKLLLLNEECGWNHLNDKDADLDHLVKK